MTKGKSLVKSGMMEKMADMANSKGGYH